MKTKNFTLKSFIAIIFAGLIISGCKKKEEPAPTPVTPVTYTSAQQNQRTSDQRSVENESNQAMDDADKAMQDCSKTRSTQAVCNMTVDTTLASQGKITLTYNGNDCSNTTSRTGSIVIQLPYSGYVTTWNTAGATAVLTFNNYKVTRLSNNKSITFNGVHKIKNVNGGGTLQLLAGNSIVHQIRANMVITFDDGTTRTWLIAKTRTFSNTSGLIKCIIAGDTTFGSYSHAAVWGTNRLGQAFTVDMPTAFSYNMFGSACLFRPLTGVIIDYTVYNTITITHGLDIFGNPATICPYGYKFQWIDGNGVTQQVILPY